MKAHKPTTLRRAALAAVLALAVACSDDDVPDIPSFLHLDAIDLVPPTENAVTTDSGFYSADIVAAYISVQRSGSRAVDTIGLFELPLTAPILINGDVEYINIYPAIAQSGKHSILPHYPLYSPIRLAGSARVGADTVPLRFAPGDTLNLGRQASVCNLTPQEVLLYDAFEPVNPSFSLAGDIGWVSDDRAGACIGTGYATLHVADTLSEASFHINRTFAITNPGNIAYLEFDYRGDLDLEISMRSSYTVGGSPVTLPVMVVYASQQWKHMYVNLGRTWSTFNHNPQFEIHFKALNEYMIDGDLFLDNLKLITSDKTL